MVATSENVVLARSQKKHLGFFSKKKKVSVIFPQQHTSQLVNFLSVAVLMPFTSQKKKEEKCPDSSCSVLKTMALNLKRGKSIQKPIRKITQCLRGI